MNKRRNTKKKKQKKRRKGPMNKKERIEAMKKERKAMN